jgi:endogenous inhibitor of DNA gyrase (YacG/DUF329 family)
MREARRAILINDHFPFPRFFSGVGGHSNGRVLFSFDSPQRLRLNRSISALFFKGGAMLEDKIIKVTCPKCGTQITEAVSFFKKPGKSCPGCGRQFTTERFRRAIAEAENLA